MKEREEDRHYRLLEEATEAAREGVRRRVRDMKFEAGWMDARAGWRAKTTDEDYRRGFALGCLMI